MGFHFPVRKRTLPDKERLRVVGMAADMYFDGEQERQISIEGYRGCFRRSRNGLFWAVSPDRCFMPNSGPKTERQRQRCASSSVNRHMEQEIPIP